MWSRIGELKANIRSTTELSSLPDLSYFVIDWIMHHALVGHPEVEVGQVVWITDLEFADDVDVFASSSENLQHVLTKMQPYPSSVGPQINAMKTKVFTSANHAAL